MAFPAVLAAIGAGAGAASSLLNVASGVKSLVQGDGGGYEGPNWKDYERSKQNYDWQLRADAKARRKQVIWDSRNFDRIAENMGVSKWALLGNSPTSMVTGQFQEPQGHYNTGSNTFSKVARMGQDIQRGIAGIGGILQLQSQLKLDEANVRLLNAQARNLNRRSGQTPPGIVEEDLPPDEYTFQQRQSERGLVQEDIVVKTNTDEIRHYPSQEIQDFISESALGEGLYMSEKLAYVKAMNDGIQDADERTNAGKAYGRSKRLIEYKVGMPVYWNGTNWVVDRYRQFQGKDRFIPLESPKLQGSETRWRRKFR